MSRSRSGEPPTGTAVVPAAAARRPAPLVARLIFFVPVRLVAGRIAPRLSARVFARVWGIVDDSEPPPRPDQPQQSVSRLALALALEGACVAVVRGLLDQASRRQFARLTGRWPSRPQRPDSTSE